MIKKIGKIFFGLCMVAGFVIMLGTAGASDFNEISMRSLVIYGGIGISLVSVGYLGAKFVKAEYIF